MRLYYAPGTSALACWISLEWAGADYEVQRVDYTSPSYQQINPLGTVPALEFDDGDILTQVPAILSYIVAEYPQADLGPGDLGHQAAAHFTEVMAFICGDLHPTLWPMFRPYHFTLDESEAAQDLVVQASYLRIDRVMRHLDSIIGDQDHIFANKRTVLDAYAYIMSQGSSRTPKPYTEYPNIQRFVDKMNEDEIVQRLMLATQA